MAAVAAPVVTPYQAPPAPSSFEAERVREFPPREAAAAEAPTGPGFAPAAPVKIEWPSDLQQVESDPEKVRTAQERVVEEEAAPRPKRVRQPLPPVDDGPLVQVETGPAETAASGGQKEKETALPG